MKILQGDDMYPIIAQIITQNTVDDIKNFKRICQYYDIYLLTYFLNTTDK